MTQEGLFGSYEEDLREVFPCGPHMVTMRAWLTEEGKLAIGVEWTPRRLQVHMDDRFMFGQYTRARARLIGRFIDVYGVYPWRKDDGGIRDRDGGGDDGPVF